MNKNEIIKEIKKYFETNNEHVTYQYLWNIAETVCREITLKCLYLKKV